MWKANRRGKSSRYDLQPYNTTLTGTPAPGQDLSYPIPRKKYPEPYSCIASHNTTTYFLLHLLLATRIRELGNSDDVLTYMLR